MSVLKNQQTHMIKPRNVIVRHHQEQQEGRVVVGMGSVGMDFLASVASFPRPDDKMRTEDLEMQGGGNCGNALTATSRLGRAHMRPRVVSKIGCDAAGDAIVAEFVKDGVDTDYLVRSGKSPFTYIIVDKETNTRTCIHTPGDVFAPEEMTQDMVDSILEGASAVYFDGRLAEAAAILAKAAREKGIPVLVEAERLRPGLDVLLHHADYVITSAHFPQQWTGKENVADAMVEILGSLPHACWISTTLGSRGALLLENTDLGCRVSGMSFEIDQLFTRAQHQSADKLPYVILPETGMRVSARSYAVSDPFRVEHSTDTDARSEQLKQEAAEKAAQMNADVGAGSRYVSRRGSTATGNDCYVMTAIQAADIPQEYIVDTTGAGDAFIGSMLFSIASGIQPVQGAVLGCLVAAVKCTKLGARPGLPYIDDIHNMY
jgi:sugar/nucleoside kinase (ribokinase family)